MESDSIRYLRPIKILLVEDSRDHAIFFKGALRNALKASHSIDVATTLEEAFEMLSSTFFDLIVLDLGLPETQGIDTLDTFFERAGTDMPVIVLTATDDERVGEEALRRGILDFLTKGYFGADQLARAVRYALERWRQRKELEKAQKDLSSFAHMAAHDLKSPVKSIGMYAQMLMEMAQERDADEDETEYIEYISLFAEQAEKLVDSLLNFSLIGEKSVRMEAVPLQSIVEQASKNLKSLVEEAGATVELGNLHEVQADEDLLLHVLQNLIGNGIKYRSEAPPRILVESEEVDGEIVVSVADNGTGIKEKFLERVFEPFRRLVGGEKEGVGLGLAICQRVVDAHHGRIWVESEFGQGSTFKFTLPPADPAA